MCTPASPCHEAAAADGRVHEVRPGFALTVPPRWRGRWEVRETVGKTYVIVRDGR